MSTISHILSSFPSFREKALSDRFFKHKDLEALIAHLSENDLFEVQKAGESFEGRSINLIKTGNGPAKIFLWSQMHGDEPTATMALFDLFNFLQQQDEFDELRSNIINNCALYILPMVNPDGAERYTRRNAQNIDINRDFNHQQSFEGRLLRHLRDKIDPHFGFNLHDQSVKWSAGNTTNPATISLLAPAYNESRSINEVRLKAIQVISGINDELQLHIPKHVGRFDDEHEPRAFGDNFQRLGTSTILVESGGYRNDLEKQFVRKLVFGAILSGLEQICLNSYSFKSEEEYFKIPENSKRHFSIIIRKCKIVNGNREYRADIGLIAEESLDERNNRYLRYLVEDLGDLEGFFGYEEIVSNDLELFSNEEIMLDKPANFNITSSSELILSFTNGNIDRKKI